VNMQVLCGKSLFSKHLDYEKPYYPIMMGNTAAHELSPLKSTSAFSLCAGPQ